MMKHPMTTAEIGKYAILAYYNRTLLDQGLITRREFLAMGRKIAQMQDAQALTDTKTGRRPGVSLSDL